MTRDLSAARVLVVEDSPTQAMEIQVLLEAAGFAVAVAADGREGLDALAAAEFDVVLSDILMPNLCGYEMCRAIKADPARRHVRVILLTALGDPQDVIQGLECGADNFLRKPYEPDDLVRRIRSVLATRGGRDPAGPQEAAEVEFLGKTFSIAAGKEQVLGFLASTFEDFVRATRREHEGRLLAERRRLEAESARFREEMLRAEKEALRASDERFRSFMDHNHAVAYMKDESGRIMYVNAPFLRCFGGAESDWIGKTDFDFWPEGVAASMRETDMAVLANGKAIELQEVVPTSEGARHLLTCKFPFRDSPGREILGGIAIDVTEQRRAEQEIRTLNVRLERRLDRLNALRRIDLSITSSVDLRVTLDVVLDQVTAQLGVHAADILLIDPGTREVEFAAGRGFRGPGITRTRLALGEGCPGAASLEGRLVFIPDLGDAGEVYARADLLESEEFVAYYGAPLIAKGQVIGVLEVFHRSRLDPDREWVDFLEALAGQAAIAVDSAALFGSLKRANVELTVAYDATIEGWARALDLRDKETEGHTRRVTEMTIRLAKAMGIHGADLVQMRRGAMLHDVGKLGIPDAILLKEGKLNDGEWEVLRHHPEHAYRWLAPIAYLRPALDIPYCHHERWDGTGYPRGLKGTEIPIAARIFAAVDIWDAVRSDRPYRKGWPEDRVRAHLRSLAGSHLDAHVVEVFLHLLEQGDRVPGAPAADGEDAARGGLSDAEVAALRGQLAEQIRLNARQNERLEEQARELVRANARLSELAAPDTLTGLLGRRSLLDALESAFSFAVRQGHPLSLILLDVDRFKAYNEAHGYSAGDAVLCTVARLVRENVRNYDPAGRFGGEEFAVILPAADASAARDFAERLRTAIAAHDWPLRPVTVSVGVATLSSSTLGSVELVEDAEAALQQSKRLGRDRVTHFDHADPKSLVRWTPQPRAAVSA